MREYFHRRISGQYVGLYKILFCLWAFEHESMLVFAHPHFV